MDHTERKLVLVASSKYAVFLKVVELGSMSKAAMHCNYSQSAVSQIISRLPPPIPKAEMTPQTRPTSMQTIKEFTAVI